MSKNWSVIGIGVAMVATALFVLISGDLIYWMIEGKHDFASGRDLLEIAFVWLAFSKRPEKLLDKVIPSNLSDEAIQWFDKTDSSAYKAYIQFATLPVLGMFILAMILSLLAGYLFKRTVSIEFFILVTLVTILLPAFIFQFKVDQECTVTDAHRIAAKEALTFVYQEQLAKPRFRRAPWVRPEVAMRAKRLGIRIEKELTNEIGHIRPR